LISVSTADNNESIIRQKKDAEYTAKDSSPRIIISKQQETQSSIACKRHILMQYDVISHVIFHEAAASDANKQWAGFGFDLNSTTHCDV
jgi:hypothetical protein